MSMRYPGGFIASTPVTAAYPSGVWTQAQAIPYQAQNVWTRDQFWPYTTLLLQGDGATNGAQNNTFLDSSSNNFTITRNGNTTQGSFTPYEQDGYWSNYFDGSSARLTIGTQAILNVGTGNFTIECFIFFPGRSSSQSRESIIAPTEATESAGVYLRLTGSTQGSTGIRAIVAGTTVSSSTPISANTWHHVAAVRNSGTVTVYVDGVSVASGSATGSLSNSASYNIGSLQAIDPQFNDFFQGYISNFRTTSTAVYTANFTPPAAPLTAITNTSLLACQSNRFKDNSTNNFTLTVNGSPSVQAFQPFPGATTWSASVLGGSGYFDGSGDYLVCGTAADWAFMSNSTALWSVEMWVYPTVLGSNDRTLLDTAQSTTANVGMAMTILTNRTVQVEIYRGSAGTYVVTGSSTSTLVANQWNHILVTYDQSLVSQNLKFYINGGSAETANKTANAPSSSNPNRAMTIATYGAGVGQFFTGYIGSMRISNVIRSSGVPTAPYTSDANTVLLTNFTNAGIYDNSMMNNLETVGNAQVSTSVVKYGTGSMAFDGSGDYLFGPANQNAALGTGDFTLEAWVYVTTFSTTTGFQAIFSNRNSNSAQASFDFGIRNSDRYLYFYNRNTDVSTFSTSGLSGTNTWIHVALVRVGSTITFYINGTAAGTVSVSTNSFGSSNVIYVGTNFNTTPDIYNGYIDDLRITKAARYLTSFTSPPARMPGQ